MKTQSKAANKPEGNSDHQQEHVEAAEFHAKRIRRETKIETKKKSSSQPHGTDEYEQLIAEDASMLAMLKPYQDFGQQKLMVEIGSTDGKFEGDRAVVRSKPASMAVLIGLAMMEKTRADFAVVNGGGVRDSFGPGKLTYKDILKVQPFGNTIITFEAS